MVSARASRPGEFALIERYFRPLAGNEGAFGLIDDAALYRPRPDEDLVLTVDTVAAGVHFLADDPAASIARKALRVNLSDLAAKGATPVGYLLALALPANWSEKWVREFAKGLEGDQKTFGIALFGGDTTRASGGLTLSVTAFGSLPKGEIVLRSGARAGDHVFVSGTIGDAALALDIQRGRIHATKRAAAGLRERYLHPQPRLALAPVLRRFAASGMDVSDGLVGDLAHICKASGVGAVIDAGSVPLSADAQTVLAKNAGALQSILTGGDDYEILATVREDDAVDFVKEAASVGIPVTRIGRIVEKKGPPIVLGSDGEPLRLAGFGHTHF